MRLISRDELDPGQWCMMAGLLGAIALAAALPAALSMLGRTAVMADEVQAAALAGRDPLAAEGVASLEPGLMVRFVHAQTQRRDRRTARLPALHVPGGEPATPFLEPGPFEAVFEGFIDIPEDDTYVFSSHDNGRVLLTVSDTTVLDRDIDTAAGDADRDVDAVYEGKPIELAEGTHAFRLRYRSPEGERARLRLLWSGSLFGPEVLPPEKLRHEAKDPSLKQAQRLRQGRSLMAQQQCLQCHQPEDEAWLDASRAMPELERDAPSLVDVGSRLRVGWMQRWLEDPQVVRESSTMPHLLETQQEAADVAAYLATLGEAPEAPEAEGGRQRADGARIEEGGRLYARQGCVGCHTLDAPKPGEQRLSLAQLGKKWHDPALEAYLKDPAKHHAWTGMPDFRLDEREAMVLTAFLLDQDQPAPERAAAELDGDIERGQQLVQQRGCLSCHEAPVANLHESPSLEALMQSDWDRGCLAEEASERGQAPRLAIRADEREALRELVGREPGLESLRRRSSVEFADRQVRSLDCRACHEIDGEPDRWSEHMEEVAHLLGEDDEPDNPLLERRPRLTWVGEQLQPQWLEDAIAGTLEHEPRGWMAARMPGFGEHRARPLAEGLAAGHGLDPAAFEFEEPDRSLASRGQALAAVIAGFNCQSCHSDDGGVPAVDMDLLAERLWPDYYMWKMRTPRRVDPQTPMPQFADPRDPEGRTRLRQHFGGDAERQFEAIWHYLLSRRVGYTPEVAEADADADADDDADDADAEPTSAELYQAMDKGPFYSGVIEVPDDGRRDKGMSIRLGDRRQASVHFDHDLLRHSAAWTGAFLEFHSNNDHGIRNSPPPSAAGQVRFTSGEATGWTVLDADTDADDTPSFTDTRDHGYGPIPEEEGRYHGVYLHGERAVLAYAYAGVEIRDSPWFVEPHDEDGAGAFARDIHVEAHDRPLATLLFDTDEPAQIEQRGETQIAIAQALGSRVRVAAIGAAGGEAVGLTASAEAEQVALRFDPQGEARSARVLLWEGDREELDDLLALAADAAAPNDMEALTGPGPARRGEPLLTEGDLGGSQNGYAVDVITAPYDNPHDALLYFTGVDFLPDGRAVLSTMHGDIWIVDGIDEELDDLTWQRFATGLNHPFGVRVVNGMIYASCDDELVRLHDRNGDGEADYYESFANLITPGAGAWRHAFGLEVDDEGYFYVGRGRGSPHLPERNGLLRVSPDGSEWEIIATGFRQPWAMGISPSGNVSLSQQEGPWVPQTPVHKVDLDNREGSFYGFRPDRYRREDPYPREIGYEPPIVWMPRHVDHSGRGQVWVEPENWGLPQHQMLHFTGRRTILQVMHERVEGDRQGGVVALPVRPRLISPRVGRFREQDGQLYVAGHRGWGGIDGALERIRHTGEPVHLPVAIHAHEDGVRIRFNHPIRSANADEIERYVVHRWNYQWDSDYGSHHYSVEEPDRLGEDPVPVESVTVISDEELFLRIADMQPVHQMRISYNLEAADGTVMQEDIYATFHHLNPAFER